MSSISADFYHQVAAGSGQKAYWLPSIYKQGTVQVGVPDDWLQGSRSLHSFTLNIYLAMGQVQLYLRHNLCMSENVFRLEPQSDSDTKSTQERRPSLAFRDLFKNLNYF